MNWKQIVISAVVFALVAQIIHTVGAVLTMDYYVNPAYFALWSKLMMPEAGPPGTEFFVASLVVNFAIGLTFAGVYSMLKKSIPGKGLMKGVNYGLLLFLLAGLPYTLTTYLLLAVPAMLLVGWAVEALILYIICGATFSKIVR